MKGIGSAISLLIGLTWLGGCSAPTGDITSDYVEAVVADAGREALRRGKKDALSRFSVLVKTSDRFGSGGEAAALTFSWVSSDLARVNWREIDSYKLLDLSSVRIDHRNGVMALHHWCDPDGFVLTPRLCGAERSRAENDWVARGG